MHSDMEQQMTQGRRPDQIAANERIGAFVAIAGVVYVAIGAIVVMVRQ